MKSYPYILFDLDGTLIDSGNGVRNAVAYSLRKLGITPPENLRELDRFIGPPLTESYDQFYHIPQETIPHAIDLFQEYYRGGGLYESQVYDGIPELLDRLNAAGRRLLVATSKPEMFAKPLLAKMGLAEKFAFIAGADGEGTARSEKNAVIQYALSSCGITDLSSVVMVGDRKYDINGANFFGIDSIGILWGFGDAAELNAAGATYLAETPKAVGDLLLNI